MYDPKINEKVTKSNVPSRQFTFRIGSSIVHDRLKDDELDYQLKSTTSLSYFNASKRQSQQTQGSSSGPMTLVAAESGGFKHIAKKNDRFELENLLNRYKKSNAIIKRITDIDFVERGGDEPNPPPSQKEILFQKLLARRLGMEKLQEAEAQA